MEPLVSEKELREAVGVSAVAWWDWRKKGKTPQAIIINGRRKYRPNDIEAWLESKKETAVAAPTATIDGEA